MRPPTLFFMAAVAVCIGMAAGKAVVYAPTDDPERTKGEFGVDISGNKHNRAMTLDEAKCLLDSGYSFVSIRAYRSIGEVDTNAVESTANALQASREHPEFSFTDVDAYLFPCRSDNPVDMLNAVFNMYETASVETGRIWLDIESNPKSSCSWSTQASMHTANCNWIKDAVAHTHATNRAVGVYTTKNFWSQYVGTACDDIRDYLKTSTGNDNAPQVELWYAHDQTLPDYSDYNRKDNRYTVSAWPSSHSWPPQEGSAQPYRKQYYFDQSVCGLNADLDWSPGANYKAPFDTALAVGTTIAGAALIGGAAAYYNKRKKEAAKGKAKAAESHKSAGSRHSRASKRSHRSAKSGGSRKSMRSGGSRKSARSGGSRASRKSAGKQV